MEVCPAHDGSVSALKCYRNRSPQQSFRVRLSIRRLVPVDVISPEAHHLLHLLRPLLPNAITRCVCVNFYHLGRFASRLGVLAGDSHNPDDGESGAVKDDEGHEEDSEGCERI